MQEFGLESRNFNNLSDDELDSHVLEITLKYSNCGELMRTEMMKHEGIKIQRFRLRDSLARVDPDGIKRRKKGRLKRRVYNVQGANDLWHLDTNHILVRWFYNHWRY